VTEVSGIVLRVMTGGDIAAGMHLKDLAGWNQTAGDWALFTRLSPGRCFAAVQGERVVGTVTTLRYPGRVAWVSMLLVDPAFRGCGIGSRLFERAVAAVRDWGTVALDATPAGQGLYARRGFAAGFRIDRTVIARVPRLNGERDAGMARIGAHDWPAIAALDGQAFAADRTAVLHDLWDRAPEMAWRRMREGRLVGAVLGRRGTRYAHVGPLVAETAGDALVLCRACLSGLEGMPAVLDVPAYQGELRDALAELGFTRQRSLQRMTLAPEDEACPFAGDDRRQYAIAGPELG
jgi:GNAT superfamily N-acetyltransferase